MKRTGEFGAELCSRGSGPRVLARTFPSQGLGDDTGGGDGGSNPEGPAGTRKEGGTGVGPPIHTRSSSRLSLLLYSML